MHDTPTLRRHVILMDEAAKRNGMDLQDAVIRGALEMCEISKAVERCCRCALPDVCETWRAPAENTALRVPPFCKNKDLFNRISETLI